MSLLILHTSLRATQAACQLYLIGTCIVSVLYSDRSSTNITEMRAASRWPSGSFAVVFRLQWHERIRDSDNVSVALTSDWYEFCVVVAHRTEILPISQRQA